MASGTRTVTSPGIAVFDFQTLRAGTVSFFSNDLNINWRVTAQGNSGILIVHAGPILFLSSFITGAGVRVQAVPLTIGSGFPPPPLSLLELQTDTIVQTPALLEDQLPVT